MQQKQGMMKALRNMVNTDIARKRVIEDFVQPGTSMSFSTSFRQWRFLLIRLNQLTEIFKSVLVALVMNAIRICAENWDLELGDVSIIKIRDMTSRTTLMAAAYCVTFLLIPKVGDIAFAANPIEGHFRIGNRSQELEHGSKKPLARNRLFCCSSAEGIHPLIDFG